MDSKQKFVFLDCEFTSSHAKTTLISAGLVTLDGKELYIELNDYDKNQISDWVREHVLPLLKVSESVSSNEACQRISKFLEDYSNGEKISIVSAGKALDILLLFQLWHTQYQELPYFSFERYLPFYLNHRRHFDLDTMFFMNGYDPDLVIREKFAGRVNGTGEKHNALFDARIVRECFLALQTGKAERKIALPTES